VRRSFRVRLDAARTATPLLGCALPCKESGTEVVDLQQHVQSDGRKHQRGNDSHEQSPSVRRCVARAKDGDRMLQRGCDSVLET
jgi:hypothetical protein